MISWKRIPLPQDNSGHRVALLRHTRRGLTLVFGLCLSVLAQAQAVSDVRVVIDVSGSMKQNDPQNLRVPALRLLVELLPEGTRAGVWTFGQSVDMSVPLGTINKASREQAQLAASKIHSRGLLTNIEEAVRKASAGWEKPDPRYHRHMILLTDGVVDIGKDPRVNADSRRRLLEEVLPALEQADATVHTIALAAGADVELLQAISSATDGAFEQVNSAEQLQRIFLRLFEKSVEADTLPLTDNKFVVDKNISDITVLVFLAKDSAATQLTPPGKTPWSQQDHPQSAQWHHESGYDLITVKSPEAGEWVLQAKLDPDNRVLVVTNLRMKVDKLPNTMMLGDTVTAQVRLFEDSKTITNPNLLDKTKFVLKQTSGKDPAGSTEMKDDGQAPDVLKGDGVFTAPVSNIQQAGEYDLVIQATSLTFQREAHHSLHVYDSPANIAITQAAADKPFRISVQPHAGLIRPETVSMQLKLPSLEPQTINHVTDAEWVIEVPAKHANEKFVLTMVATRYDDKPLKIDFEQTLAVTAQSQSLAIKTTPAAAEDEALVEDEAGATEQVTDESVDDANEELEKKKKGFDWKLVLGIVIGANLFVFTGAWLIYRRIRKKRQQQAAKDEKDLQV